MSRERGRYAALAVMAVLAVLVFAGCGSDFNDDPKPPVPLEATIEISPTQVDVEPRGFGAGLVNFVIANNSDAEAAVVLRGPVDQTSSPVPAAGNGIFRVEMKTGDYAIAVVSHPLIKLARLTVGAERPPSNNVLQLP
jgi:hypothetical protein